MPRPIFDIEQYELRGKLPTIYTPEQQELLDLTLSRVNGQIDWNAQLLGFNGANYWGRPNPKKDGTYNWVGLPETVSEKRAMQTGTFAVYNKDELYSNIPAPFNRSVIGASGDFTLDIWEEDGLTHLTPIYQSRDFTFDEENFLIVGGSYFINAEVEVSVPGGTGDEIFVTVDRNQGITELRILEKVSIVGIKKKNSSASEARLVVENWEDISDWNSVQVKTQYIGIWGNKGNQISSDFALDSLNVHGFNEEYGLSLPPVESCISVVKLLSFLDFKPASGTFVDLTSYSFVVDGCDSYYAPVPPTTIVDGQNEVPFGQCVTDDYIIDFSAKFGGGSSPLTTEAGLELTTEDGDVLITESALFDEVCIKYTATSAYGKVKFPCIQWIVDPTLDNGEFGNVAWATADAGEYDQAIDPNCYDHVSQTADKCQESCWNGFDDGIYDKLVSPNCEAEPQVGCASVDGEFYSPPLNPSASANNPGDCCEIDNGPWDLEYTGPQVVDGGSAAVEQCTLYDNSEYGVTDPPAVTCTLDNGTIGGIPAPTGGVDEEIYDRTYSNCVECVAEGDDPEVIPCPLDPIRVQLEETFFAGAIWKLEPSIRNSFVPLRTWKQRVLTVVDETRPNLTPAYSNNLICDLNSGPQDAFSYRNFLRLPVEYVRNGKYWGRAEAVASNQNYFSTPPNLSETNILPSQVRPMIYSEVYSDDLAEDTILYAESYIVSEISQDTEDVQPDFDDSVIAADEETSNAFTKSSTSFYSAYQLRIPDSNGDWQGDYYQIRRGSKLSGFLERDVLALKLDKVAEVNSPVSDYSVLKAPNVELPDQNDLAPIKNYSVCYAYFAADVSASDDPVFEPQNLNSWRNETVQSRNGVVQTNTDYLLH